MTNGKKVSPYRTQQFLSVNNLLSSKCYSSAFQALVRVPILVHGGSPSGMQSELGIIIFFSYFFLNMHFVTVVTHNATMQSIWLQVSAYCKLSSGLVSSRTVNKTLTANKARDLILLRKS